MILTKGILRNARKNFLCSCGMFRTQNSSLHILRTPNYVRVAVVRKSFLLRTTVRYESSTTVINSDPEKLLNQFVQATSTVKSDTLPEIVAPQIIEKVIELNKLGEPTLSSLGLGSWWPPGLLQRWLEFVHVTFDLPWWMSISITVVLLRLAMFPLIIKSQRNTVKMHNLMPKMREIQDKLNEAKTYGNNVEMMKKSHELGIFMRDNKLNPIGSMTLPMIQAPVFLSFFMALRKMSALPVESLTYGGALWFVDLTLPDQTYGLPIITCLTLGLTLKIGADFGKLQGSGSQLGKYMKYMYLAIPALVFPFIINFQNSLLVYWATTNFVSLVQVLFLRIPKVRTYFAIEPKKRVEAPKAGVKNFYSDFKNTMANSRIAREIRDRERLDEMNFKRAGRAPPLKTFKQDPTLSKAEPMQAKNR